MRKFKHGFLGKIKYYEEFKDVPPTTEERRKELLEKMKPWEFDPRRPVFVGGKPGGTPTPPPGPACDFTYTLSADTILTPTIIAGANGSSTFLISNDLVSWSANTTSPLLSNAKLLGAEGQFVLGDSRRGTYDRIATMTGQTATPVLSTFPESDYQPTDIGYASWLNTYMTGIYEDTHQFVSTDGGKTWSANTTTLFYNKEYDLLIDEDNQEIILVDSAGDVWRNTTGVTGNNVVYNQVATLDATPYQALYRNSTLGLSMVVVSNGSKLFISSDNTTWSGITLSTGMGSVWKDSISVRPSDGRTLIVSYTNGTGSISDDGINWSATTLPNIDGNFYLTSLYVPAPVDLFVAVSRSGKVVTSPDGITWTQQTQNTTLDVYAVKYGYFN